MLLKILSAIQIFILLKKTAKGSEYADVLYDRRQTDNRVHPEDNSPRSDVLDDAQP